MSNVMTLFSCGSNGNGQLGLGHEEDLAVLTKVSWHGPNIQEIACGGNHTLILAGGDVYACGLNDDYRCGTDAPKKLATFRKIEHSETWQHVSATWEASFLTTNTKVYACGRGLRGELGLGEGITTSKLQALPDFVPAGETIASIRSCVSHTVVLLNNGKAFGWGNGRKGQVGAASIHWLPQEIDVGFPVEAIACGNEFTVLAGRSLRILGSDKWRVQSSQPELAGWQNVFAGWGHIYILNDNALISWGRNDRGQAGQDIPALRQLAAGSEHAVGITMDGQVIAWGWGEHGNTGGGEGAAWQLLREVDLEARPMVAAGCATTWLYEASVQ